MAVGAKAANAAKATKIIRASGVVKVAEASKTLLKGTGELANKISKSDLYSNYKKVDDKLKVLKDPNGNYARMAKELGYDNFNMDSWKKGIQSFKSADGLRIEYHFVKNIDEGTVIGEKNI